MGEEAQGVEGDRVGSPRHTLMKVMNVTDTSQELAEGQGTHEHPARCSRLDAYRDSLHGIAPDRGVVPESPIIHTIPVLQKRDQQNVEWYDLLNAYSNIRKNVNIHKRGQNSHQEALFPIMKNDIGISNQERHESSPVHVNTKRANGMGGLGT